MIPAGHNGEARLGFLNFVAGQGYVFWVAESGWNERRISGSCPGRSLCSAGIEAGVRIDMSRYI
jgi:hypothetical protein